MHLLKRPKSKREERVFIEGNLKGKKMPQIRKPEMHFSALEEKNQNLANRVYYYFVTST